MKRRALRAAGVLALAAVAGAWAGTSRHGCDFAVFHLAGQRALQGEPLYRFDEAPMVYKYSPAAAFFFSPLSLVPRPAANGLFVFASVLALARFAGWSRRHASAPSPAHLVLLGFAPFVLQLLAYGQCDPLLWWLIIESHEQAGRRPWLSGLCWAIACAFKPPYLIFALPVIAFGEWRRLASMAASTVALHALAALRYGSLGPLSDWCAVHQATVPDILCGPSNSSVFALACLLAGPEGSPLFLPAVGLLSVAVTALLTAAVRRHPHRERARFFSAAAGLYLAWFLSPLGWWAGIAAAMPLAYEVAATLVGRPPGWVRAACAGALAALGAAALLTHQVLGADRVFPLLEWRPYGLAGLVLVLAATATAHSPRLEGEAYRGT